MKMKSHFLVIVLVMLLCAGFWLLIWKNIQSAYEPREIPLPEQHIKADTLLVER